MRRRQGRRALKTQALKTRGMTAMKTTPFMRQPILRTLGSIAVLAVAAALPLDSQAASLTLYNAQHEQVVAALAKDFEKQTGISVKVRNGEGPAMAAQLV